jgi:hypothetical protein
MLTRDPTHHIGSTLCVAHLQVLFLDCSKPFVSGGKVLDSLMPDALHPNGPGTSPVLLVVVAHLTSS